jgi:hypothetical protein
MNLSHPLEENRRVTYTPHTTFLVFDLINSNQADF